MSAAFKPVERFLLVIDRAMVGGLGALVVFTPLAIGSVNRAAVVAIELTVFALVLNWMIRSIIGRVSIVGNSRCGHGAARVALPVAAMTVLVAVQLIPMPPSLLHLLSPAAYRVYQIAF